MRFLFLPFLFVLSGTGTHAATLLRKAALEEAPSVSVSLSADDFSPFPSTVPDDEAVAALHFPRPLFSSLPAGTDRSFLSSLPHPRHAGPMGGDPGNDTLINSGHNQVRKGIRKHHPTTYEEVAGIVRWVKARGGKLRAQGTLHSWSNIFADDNTDVIFLDKFKGISQSPEDYTVVTIQAGVLQLELAHWADSPERGYGRFSYLPQNTLIGGITFVGACQTASHGSGYVGGSTPDSVVGITLINADGDIKTYDHTHPDLPIFAACLGLCGIILQVTVRFSVDTSAVQVTTNRRPFYDLFPPRGTPINESFNPLKQHISVAGRSGGAISYATYNSAPQFGDTLDASKIDLYHEKDLVWSLATAAMPGVPVPPVRFGVPGMGTQTEYFYDKNLFYALDYAVMGIGSWVQNYIFGETRPDKSTNFNPRLANLAGNLEVATGTPTGLRSGSVTFKTSHASSQHFFKYVEYVAPENDFELAFKADDDYANIYEAHAVLVEEQDWMLRNRGMYPLSVFSGVRWTDASSCPLSHVYGNKGDKFVLVEVVSTRGTPGWEEYAQRVFNRWRQIKNKKDGSAPKPHWAKWDERWTPDIYPYIKEVYASQIEKVRPIILAQDPSGLFRTKFLSELFELPF